MPSEIVVDANVVVNFALKSNPFHEQARKLFADCTRDGTRLIAPPWWELEADNALRFLARGKHITPAVAQEAQQSLDMAAVQVVWEPRLRVLARQIADRLQQIRLDDATYVTLAQLRGCDLWTADLRLCNNAQSLGLSLVRSIATYSL